MSTTQDHTGETDWYARACKILNTNASREAIDHARESARVAANVSYHEIDVDVKLLVSELAAVNAAIGDVLAHLQGFARASSHEDLIAEIDCLARDVDHHA